MIVAFNGTAITSAAALIDALVGAHPGQLVRLTVQRGMRRLTLSVTLGTQPRQAPSQ